LFLFFFFYEYHSSYIFLLPTFLKAKKNLNSFSFRFFSKKKNASGFACQPVSGQTVTIQSVC